MNANAENPFDILSLATGDSLFGREDELAWLDARLRNGANLLLFGGDGVGKSSLLQQAGNAFSARESGFFIRLELAIHRSTIDTANAIDGAAAKIVATGASPRNTGVLGDAPVTRVGHERLDTAASVGDSVNDPVARLLRSLQRLNTIAQVRGVPIAVAFDSSQEFARLGGAALESALLDSTQRHLGLTHIFSSTENAIDSTPVETLRRLHTVLESRCVQALEPHAFAQWIDRRFAEVNIVSRGAGAACVDRGGPSTAQTIDLAQRTFELSIRARFANEASVNTALERGVAEQSDRFAATWHNLSEPERKILTAVARAGGQGLFDSESMKRMGVRDADDVKRAVSQLVDKKLVEPAGPGHLRLPSALFKQWTLTAGVGFSRGVNASPTRFSFSFQSSQSLVPARAPRP